MSTELQKIYPLMYLIDFQVFIVKTKYSK